MQTIGIVGFGPFGRLLVEQISPKAEAIKLYNRSEITSALPANVTLVDLEELADCDGVILALPVSALEATLHELAGIIRPETIVIDVCSVKLVPMELMLRLLPEPVAVVGSHPLFGPQSITDDEKPTVVLCEGRDRAALQTVTDFYRRLGWETVERTAEEHDKTMATVHGLTFFIAQSLIDMQLDTPSLPTGFYAHLQKLIDMQRHHTDDLTDTVEQYNPYAKAVRSRFLKAADELNERFNKAT